MSTISTGTLLTTAFKVTSDLSGTLQIQTGASSANAVYIDSSQNVGIGTIAPSTKLDVNGTITGTGVNLTGLTATKGVFTDASKNLTSTGTLAAIQGGTDQSSYAIGDLLYASTTTALSKLADVATGNALISGGIGVAPSYGKIGLTTHISGTLAVGNGGTGLTTGTSGGIPYFSSTSAIASSALLAANALMVGGGAGVAPATVTTGTGVVTALGVAVGTAGAFVVNGGVLGTPSSGTVTNLTGTASININGTVGATTATTGAFTTLSATGVTTVQAGTVLLPAITTSGDTNTGIFFPAADTIAFSEGGAEAMRITSDGNLNVGTTTSTTFKISSAGHLAFTNANSNTDNSTDAYRNGIGWQSTNQPNGVLSALITADNSAGYGANVLFLTRGTGGGSLVEKMRIDSSGNVGIGTSSPGYKLDVQSTASSGAPLLANFQAAGGDVQLYVQNGTVKTQLTADATNSASIVGSFSAHPLVFRTSNTERMRIDTSGNVGIGLTNPSIRLDVVGASNVSAAIIKAQGALPDNNDNAGLYVLHQGTTGTGLRVRTDQALTGSNFAHVMVNNASASINGLQVSQYGTGYIASFDKSGTVAMRIDSSGNVGIGTTSPGYKLAIKQTSGDTQFAIQGAVKNWNFRNQADGTFGLYDDSLGYWRYMYDTSSNHIWFNGSGTERMRIDSSGNFLVGTTSSNIGGQSINGIGVSRAGAAVFALNNSNNTNQAWHHFIYDSGLGAAGTYSIGQIINGSTGGLAGGPFVPILNMAVPSAASNSPKVTIDASGNVGIGTASPAYKLDVNGNINIPADSFYYIGTTSPNDRYIRYRSSQNDVLYSGYSGLFYKQDVAGVYHAWFTGNNERVRIDSSGLFKFNSGYGSAATAYGCRAWCQYNQSATIVGAGNISSVTIVDTGDVRLNFATAMPDTIYSAVATTNESGGQPKWCNSTQPSTTDIRIVTFNASQSKGWFEYNFVAVFR